MADLKPGPSASHGLKISLAVPSLNYGRYLRACLESIRQQTHADFEVLIADGGSTDESLTVIREFVASDARFRLVSTADSGQADALNKALAEATGEIHGYLNADDEYLCSDAFEAVASAFTTYAGMDLVSFRAWYVDANSRPLRPVELRFNVRDNFGWMRRRTAVVQPATLWRSHVTRRFPFRGAMHYAFDSWFFYEAFTTFSWMEFEKPIAGMRAHPMNKSIRVIPARINEIAALEAFKYGEGTWRSRYVSAVGVAVGLMGRIPVVGDRLRRLVYLVVNSLAYASFYRLPGI